MKFLNAIVNFLKVAFSGFATNIFSANKRNGIVIYKNKKTEISNNQANDVNVTIKKNEDTIVSENKWT